MRDNHARGKLGRRFTHEDAFTQRKESHAVQLRQPSAAKVGPSAAAVCRRQHDADPETSEGHRRPADDPADPLTQKTNASQRTVGRRAEQPPIPSSVLRPPDHAMIADGPAEAAIQELNIMQVGVVLDRRWGDGRECGTLGRGGSFAESSAPNQTDCGEAEECAVNDAD